MSSSATGGASGGGGSGGQQPPSLGRLVYRKDLTPDLAILRVEPADGSQVPEYRAGQFVTLGLRVGGEDKITYRAYSLASPPEQRQYFEFYIKWATEPVMGKFTSALFGLKEGDEIYWRKPTGAFTIEEKRPDGSPETRRMVLVASGTGVAPFISYALHLKSAGTKRKVMLLHGARYAQELGYRELLESLEKDRSWDFRYMPTVSRPDDARSRGWRGAVGRVEALLVGKGGEASELEKAAGEKITPQNSFFYVCGYQGTIDSVVSVLGRLGFVTNRNRRQDGSFDIKIETYG